jgi:hypothetical protein
MTNPRIFSRGLAFLVLMILAAACSNSATPAALEPAATLESEINIQVSNCRLTLDRVQTSELFPPGCQPGSPNCLQMEPGRDLLTLWLANPFQCDLPTVVETVIFEDLYLSAPDGTRSERLIAGVQDDFLVVGFALESPPNNLILHWGSATPIKLPAIQP